MTQGPATSGPIDSQNAFGRAVQCHRAGRLDEAEAIYKNILAAVPNHADCHYWLGVIACQRGRHKAAIEPIERAIALSSGNPVAEFHSTLAEAFLVLGQFDGAIDHFRRAVAIKPSFAQAHYNLGLVFQGQGRFDEAAASYRRLLAVRPDDAEAHVALGAALKELGRLDEAAARYRHALVLQPNAARAHYNLGVVHREQGGLEEAEACYRRALALIPGFVQAHNNLGNVLKDRGKPEEARTHYERALSLKPDYAEAHNNLGSLLKDQGRLAEAIAKFERALALKPNFIEAHLNLGRALIAHGDTPRALDIAVRALRIGAGNEAKALFVQCLQGVRFDAVPAELRELAIQALSEPWDRPSELAGCAAGFVKSSEPIGECIERASRAYPGRLSAEALFGLSGFAAVSQDRLLRVLLRSTPVCDVGLERFLTLVRFTLIEAAEKAGLSDAVDENALALYGALAQQCFINEYVFAVGDEERERARRLRDRLVTAAVAGNPVPLFWPVAVAAYFPLGSLAVDDALLARPWPGAVTDLVTQQVAEPREERQYKTAIRHLTPIEDSVSLSVKQQYEESPYPRWVKPAPALTALTIDALMRSKFPFAAFRSLGKANIDILIAGCGTGQHAIEAARRFAGARVLAIDLSLASLSYARRKTVELGLTDIEYAEADILQLGSLGRTFDVVEAVGVLHHLSDPTQGWSALLSVLRPGGFMHLGFYSELARRDIAQARLFIAEQKYGPSADGIRRFRQDLIDLNDGRFDGILKSNDFFSTSTCRDLLFHVQEHRLTLPEIKAFLEANNLAFIGFDVRSQLVRAYRSRFPGDRSLCDLDSWHVFETENPDSFIGMYQFWIQKVGS